MARRPGYALGISNPQAIAFYVALLPAVVDVQHLNLTTYLLLCVVLACTMLLIAAAYALLAARLRSLLRFAKARRLQTVLQVES